MKGAARKSVSETQIRLAFGEWLQRTDIELHDGY